MWGNIGDISAMVTGLFAIFAVIIMIGKKDNALASNSESAKDFTKFKREFFDKRGISAMMIVMRDK